VVGKPHATFFELGSAQLDASPDEMLMVGDDLINDIEGAQTVGYHAVLVQTGKYRQDLVDLSPINPNGIIASVAGLPDYLSSLEQR
jgi:ribonucleotide monophosphatase NagD (HAD superfamily)